MDVVFQIGVYIPLLPAILAVYNWKRLTRAQQWFGYLLIGVALFSISGRVWVVLGNTNNLPFFHSYILFECTVYILIYRWWLPGIIAMKTGYVLVSAFTGIWLLNVIWGEGWWGYPAYIHSLEAIILMVLSVVWFVQALNRPVHSNLIRTFEFWVNTGVFMFFGSNLLLFTFSTFVAKQSSKVFDVIWGVHALLAIILYINYTIALLWVRKTQPS